MFDSPIERHQGRKRRTLTWWLLLITGSVALGLVYYVTFGPNPPIRVSKATTHLTTPLAADGLPDYASALLAEMRKGVTLENNGAVLFVQAMWPPDRDEDTSIPAEEGQLLCQELGIDGPPLPQDRVTSLDTPKRRLQIVSLIRDRLLKAGSSASKPNGQIEYYDRSDAEFLAGPASLVIDDDRVDTVRWNCDPVGRPWRRVDLPFVAEWLDENQQQFDAVVEAVERPQWYMPNPEWRRGGRGATTVLSMEWIFLYREATRHLYTQSFFHQGERRFDAAARDALAIRRLASQVGRHPFYIDQLIAIAIDGVGLSIIDQLAADPKVPLKVLQALLDKTQQVPIASDVGRAADLGERYFFLDRLLLKPQEIDEYWGRKIGWLSWTRIDWNEVLLAANKRFDEIRKAAATRPWPARRDAIAAIDLEAQEFFDPDVKSTTSRFLGYALPATRSKQVANHVSAALTSNVATAFEAEDQNRVRAELTRVGIALAIHLAERGSYPEAMSELVPSVLPKVPVDPLHGLPLGYRRTEDGYLLYAVGPNGIDDGGSNAGYEGGGTGSPTYEGIALDGFIDESSNTLTAEEQAAYDLIEQIPEGADDVSLRLPLPIEPWPWEIE